MSTRFASAADRVPIVSSPHSDRHEAGDATPHRPVDATAPFLQISGLHKRYGGVRALRGANLTISGAGVVHGLIGANGSGKSTLLKILSGQERPEQGQVSMNGKAVSFSSPADAVHAGIAMVAQETALAGTLTVTENVLLGRPVSRWGRVKIDWPATRRRAVEVLDSLGVDLDPEARVASLRPDQRQLVEIARAVSMDVRLVILDEPTSSLTADEVADLMSGVRRLTQHGVSFVFVSHRLKELFDIADELTVLRDGVTASAGPIGDFDPDSLVEAMIGGVEELRPGARVAGVRRELSGRPMVLEVSDVSVTRAVHSASLQVREGEIVGLAGLVGAGRQELLEAVFGARSRTSGTVAVGGRTVAGSGPAGAIAAGIGYLPADRKTEGLVQAASIGANFTMVSTLGAGRLRRPRPRAEAHQVAELGARLRLSGKDVSTPVRALSGGNQQKVALGKWLMDAPSVLLCDEPTRGVDVLAKEQIHELLRSLADDGLSVLVSSSEDGELLAICDRILVMYGGHIVAELDASSATETQIAAIGGGHAG